MRQADSFLSKKTRYHSFGNEPRIDTAVISTRSRQESLVKGTEIKGCGTGLSQLDCETRAYAEMLERHALYSYEPHSLVFTSARELGEEAVDIFDFPVCSDLEYSHPKMRVSRPSNDKPISWIRATSLRSGRSKYVPAQSVFVRLPPASEDRFLAPISTGAAAHCDLIKAINSALLEVVERDALAVSWLLRLTPPVITNYSILLESDETIRSWAKSSSQIQYHFVDLSLDTGIPTVLGVRYQPGGDGGAQLACSAACSPSKAVAKVIRDFAAHRIGANHDISIPRNAEDCTRIHHGLAYMSREDKKQIISKICSSTRSIHLNDLNPPTPLDTSASQLRYVLARLEELNKEAFVVNLSNKESIAAGIYVVKVVVPGLQPLPYNYLARSLGHSRLQQASLTLTGKPFCEENVNPWPIPFA